MQICVRTSIGFCALISISNPFIFCKCSTHIIFVFSSNIFTQMYEEQNAFSIGVTKPFFETFMKTKPLTATNNWFRTRPQINMCTLMKNDDEELVYLVLKSRFLIACKTLKRQALKAIIVDISTMTDIKTTYFQNVIRQQTFFFFLEHSLFIDFSVI